jgi:hypothetical protein
MISIVSIIEIPPWAVDRRTAFGSLRVSGIGAVGGRCMFDWDSEKIPADTLNVLKDEQQA